MPISTGPEALVRGAGLAYQRNAWQRDSERLAAEADELRRREIMRREVINNPTLSSAPDAPNLNPGVRMRAPTAPPAAPPARGAIANGPLLESYRQRAATSQAPELPVGPQTHFDSMLASLPELAVSEAAMTPVQRTQWAQLQRAYGRLTRGQIDQREYQNFLDSARRAGLLRPESGGGVLGAAVGQRIAQRPRAGVQAQSQAGQSNQAGRAEEVAAMLRANGIRVTSVVRTDNQTSGGHDRGNSIDVAAGDRERAIQLVQQHFPDLASEMIPVSAGQRFSSGAVSTGDHGHIDLGPVAGPRQATQPADNSRLIFRPQEAAPAVQQAIQAAQQGPQAVSYAIRQLESQRNEMIAMMQAARTAGDATAMLQAREGVRQVNAQMLATYGANAAMGIQYTGNTDMWSQFFLETTGYQLEFQPYTDGSYEIVIGGVAQGRQTRDELTQNALQMVDQDYANRVRERENSDYEAIRDSNLRRVESAEEHAFSGQIDVEVARIRAEAVRQTGDSNVQIEELQDGTRVAIYRNAQGQMVAAPLRMVPRRRPSSSGRNIQEDVLEFGAEAPLGG